MIWAVLPTPDIVLMVKFAIEVVSVMKLLGFCACIIINKPAHIHGDEL